MKLEPHYIVDDKGRRTGVVLAPDTYERLLELVEDHLDASDLDEAARSETDFVPYADVRTQLQAEGRL